MSKGNRFFMILTVLLIVGSLMIGACTTETDVAPTEPPAEPTDKPAAPDTPTEAAPEPTEEVVEEVSFEGVTLTILSQTAWWEDQYAKVVYPDTGMTLIEEFEAETGATVNVESYAYATQLEKVTLELTAGSDAYDLMLVSIDWQRGYSGAGMVDPYPDEVIANVAFDDFYGSEIIPDPDGMVYFLPYMNESDGLFVRTDLLNDPDEQAAFEEKYGYPLAAPKTFDQMVDVAEFFHRPPDLYGAAYSFKHYGGMPYAYFNARMNSFGVDTVGITNLEPNFNNEMGLRALNNLVALNQFTHPEACTWAAEGNVNFLEGKAAIYERWTTLNYYLSNPETSKVLGNFEFVPLPVWEEGDAGGTWATPWGFVIPAEGKNKEAAIALAVHLTSSESQIKAARAGLPSGRISALADPEAQEEWPYLATQYEIATTSTIFQAAPPVPEAMLIKKDVMGLNIHEAICGLQSAEEALMDAEDALNDLRAELGID